MVSIVIPKGSKVVLSSSRTVRFSGHGKVKFQDVPAARAKAAMQSFMEDELEKGSLEIADANTVSFRIKANLKLSADDVQRLIGKTAQQVALTGSQLTKSQVQSVGEEGKEFSIVTIATSQQLIMEVLVGVLGEHSGFDIEEVWAFGGRLPEYVMARSSELRAGSSSSNSL